MGHTDSCRQHYWIGYDIARVIQDKLVRKEQFKRIKQIGSNLDFLVSLFKSLFSVNLCTITFFIDELFIMYICLLFRNKSVLPLIIFGSISMPKITLELKTSVFEYYYKKHVFLSFLLGYQEA